MEADFLQVTEQEIVINGKQYIFEDNTLRRYDDKSKMWITVHFNNNDIDDNYILQLLAAK
jgi:hypothetical protein